MNKIFVNRFAYKPYGLTSEEIAVVETQNSYGKYSFTNCHIQGSKRKY